MDAFDKLGTICLVLSIVVMLPFMWFTRNDFLVMALMAIAITPIFWIAGLNTMEFLTKPFSEKGMKGFFTWVISIILALAVYACFTIILFYIFHIMVHHALCGSSIKRPVVPVANSVCLDRRP